MGVKMTKSRLPSQREIDSELLSFGANPMNLFWSLARLTTLLIILISWLALFGAMSAGVTPWAIWPYIALPIGLWVALLALPALFLARRGALAILDALAQTAEAWLARAGYSMDLNNDGYIGRVTPQTISPVEEVRPILVQGSAQLLAQQAQTIPAIAEGVKPTEEEPEARLQIRRRVWELPKLDRLPAPLKVPQETIEEFIEGVFVGGVGRGYWVDGKKLDRDTYDSLVLLLEQTKLLDGRKPGSAGKITVKNARQARLVLGIPADNNLAEAG